MHFGSLEDDREDSTAPRNTFGPQMGGHRQCGLAICAFHLGFSLGLEVPYLFGSTPRTYIPDFIVQVDDGHDDPLNLIVEIKGYRGEDAREKKNTMDAYWLPGVNSLGHYGRWAFAEFTAVYDIESGFDAIFAEMAS